MTRGSKAVDANLRRRVHRGRGRADGLATTSLRTSSAVKGALRSARMAAEGRPRGRVAGRGERGAPLRMRLRDGRGDLRPAPDLRGAAEADPATVAARLRNAECRELRSWLLAAAAGAGEEAAASSSAEKLLLASSGLLDGRTRAAPAHASPPASAASLE